MSDQVRVKISSPCVDRKVLCYIVIPQTLCVPYIIHHGSYNDGVFPTHGPSGAGRADCIIVFRWPVVPGTQV